MKRQQDKVRTTNRVTMEQMAKKLALWHTRTFRPILTHDELEPIMASVGFVPLPAPPPPVSGTKEAAKGGEVEWREYAFFRSAGAGGGGGGGERWLPYGRPRLPYPRVDGLHLMTYRAFLAALEFYLGQHFVPQLFHVRAMQLTRVHDITFEKDYRHMKESEIEEEGIFLYREGTVDHITMMVCSHISSHLGPTVSEFCISSETSSGYLMKCKNRSTYEHDDGRKNSADVMSLVSLKDLLPNRDTEIVL